jgi:hypothetical protein
VAALVFTALVVIPGVIARAQAPAGATPAGYEPLAHATREHAQTGSADYRITTVSARNDMISGGDVLVRISASEASLRVAVTLNGQAVTRAFRSVPGARSLLGLVTGLRTGDNTYYGAFGTAYTVAGMPLTNDIVVCQRKAITPSDYQVQFTPAELERLRRIFPEGVCDYTKEGIEQRPLMGTWLSFGPAGVKAQTRASNRPGSSLDTRTGGP